MSKKFEDLKNILRKYRIGYDELFKAMGLSKKKLNPKAKHNDQLSNLEIRRERQNFAQAIISLLNENKKVFFLDEMGVNTKMLPEYLWANKNSKPEHKAAHKSVNTSIIAVSDINKVRFIKIINGSVNSKEFAFFLTKLHNKFKQMKLKKNDYAIILDNAPIHTAKIIKMFRYILNLYYLPAYSPDLNLIEYHFVSWKYAFRIENHKTKNVPASEVIIKSLDQIKKSSYIRRLLLYLNAFKNLLI